MTDLAMADWRQTWAPQPAGKTEAVIRGPRATDQGYIASTWGRNLACRSRFTSKGEIRRVNDLIDRVLDRAETKLLVACAVAQPDRILGWICWAPVPRFPVLHYVYVRKEERGARIGSRLMLEAGIDPRKPFVYSMSGPCVKWLSRWPRAVSVPIADYLR
jgi:hypothetical protein